MTRTPFPKNKIGILLVWAFLVLPLISNHGSTASLPAGHNIIFSNLADPELVGPENLCLVFGVVVGDFSAGGNPETDVYTWIITGPDGKEIFNRSGGSQFETIKFIFNEAGAFTVNLSIRRNSDIIFTDSKTVRVLQGPELAILPDYLKCSDTPTEVSAINPDTPNIDQYDFSWTDIEGNVVGTTNTVSISQEGYYTVQLYLAGSSGQKDCLITGSTYVGPPLDYTIQLSSTAFCQGQTIRAGISRPISGEWHLIPPNSSEKASLGVAYEVNLGTELIFNPGIYTLIFSAKDPKFPDCKSERQSTFEVFDAPLLNVTLIEQPDNCASTNGAFEIMALSPMDSIIIVETGYKVTGISQDQNLLIDNLGPQIYSLVSYINGCENVTIYSLDTKNPPVPGPSTPEIVLPEFKILEETCSEEGVLPGSVQIIFRQGQVTGEYRVIGQSIGTLITGNLQDQDELTIPLNGGTYLLELTIDGCTYPVKEVVIPKKPVIEFTKPNQIIICESFEFLPETSQDLMFTLKFPDQSVQTLAAGESFTLTQSGEYELLGKSIDPKSGICPKLEKFTATFSQPFSFDVSLFEEDCFGNQVFKADIEGFKTEETSIRWINSDGDVVGRGELFYATSLGDFSLLVQPLVTGACPKEPIIFTIEAPILQVEVLLEANKLCPEPGTSLVELNTDSETVKTIQWIFFDDSGNRRNLPEFDNQKKIIVEAPGNYEAVVFNRIGCEIGRNFITVEASIFQDPPVIEELYGICSRGKTETVIDPGEFAEYFWYFNEYLISTDPQFSPKEVGEYNLKVVTLDGCEFFTSFRTFDGCSFEYAVPNAMVLGDPERNFEVRVSEGITEVELFIINRQGALVHYQNSKDIPYGEAFLQWDGTKNGEYIPSGTYVVVLVGKNPEYLFEEKITGSLLVLE